MVFEVVADSILSCKAAQKAGVDRIELCTSLVEGGVSPNYALIAQARKVLDIQLHVLIRPRAGDFLYNVSEIDNMLLDIEMAKQLEVDGVVFGALNKAGKVDVPVCKELLDSCGSLQVTFHRAFDMCSDPFDAFESIKKMGFERLLTSGQAANVQKGAALIKKLVQRQEGQITVMPGGGLDGHNIDEILAYTGVAECHFSMRKTILSEMMFKKANVSMSANGVGDYEQKIADYEKIKSIVSKYKSL